MNNYLLLITSIISLLAGGLASEPLSRTQPEGVCSTDELNHSILVQCSKETCKDSISDSPASNEVILISSSRSGARFVRQTLPRLSHEESERQKMLDINSTMYVYSKPMQEMVPRISGLGFSLNTTSLLAQIQDDIFRDNHAIILGDMLKRLNNGIGYPYIMIPIDFSIHPIEPLLILIDSLKKPESSLENYIKFNLIIELLGSNTEDFNLELIKSALATMENLDSLYLAWNPITFNRGDNDDTIRKLASFRLKAKFLAVVNKSLVFKFIDEHKRLPERQFDGLLLEYEPSTPYEIYKNIRDAIGDLEVHAISRPKKFAKLIGDWQIASNYATEILNHLKFGVQDHIRDNNFILDNLDEPQGESYVYSMLKGSQTYFKDPLYYALGHFSRYVTKDSMRLQDSVDTQPNMHSAKYIAILRPDKMVVVIVLNHNEHLLPFRISLNGRIEAHAYLEAKSFNTFLIQDS